MQDIKNYTWFVKYSQAFMKGHNPVLIFFKSLVLGFKYCMIMRRWRK